MDFALQFNEYSSGSSVELTKFINSTVVFVRCTAKIFLSGENFMEITGPIKRNISKCI